MAIIKRSNQHSNKEQRRYSNNYSAPSSNMILFYENELCSQSCIEKVTGIVSIRYKKYSSNLEVSSLSSASCESSTEKKKNMIEFDPCEDIYYPLDFKRDWSQELKKKFSIQMRDLCSNLDSNESDENIRRTKKQKRI